MILQLISVGLMLSNFYFFFGPSMSEMKFISKFEILYIQFSKTIYLKKLDDSLVLHTTFTIH